MNYKEILVAEWDEMHRVDAGVAVLARGRESIVATQAERIAKLESRLDYKALPDDLMVWWARFLKSQEMSVSIFVIHALADLEAGVAQFAVAFTAANSDDVMKVLADLAKANRMAAAAESSHRAEPPKTFPWGFAA